MLRARWRRWIRERTPNFLHDRGLAVPKVVDCGDHEWYRSTDELQACYHCDVTRRAAVDDVLADMRELRRGNRLDGLSIRELIDEGRR
jgi:hypothetical protein